MTIEEARQILSGCVNCGKTRDTVYVPLRGEVCIVCHDCDSDYLRYRMPQEKIQAITRAREILMEVML